VLLVVALILATTGLGGWVLTNQIVDLATKLPDYKQNIQAKLRVFRTPASGKLTKLSEAVEDLKKELPGAPVLDTNNVAKEAHVLLPVQAPNTPVLPVTPVVPVQMVDPSKNNPLQLLQLIIAPLLGPLGTAALVLLLVIFMLLKREDLRSRLIRLIGQGRISSTTRVMDDAGKRVSRYLVMQLVVNVTYGLGVAIGLYFIGVPNAVLWGASAAVLRFIPYLGPWIGAAIPIALSLAVSPGWVMPVLTVGLFLFLELVSNNVMEPWLYGASTGVTPIALIVAAVFWTWLWGPVGLVLATPLTVCLVVMGRHVPRLAFLRVLLSDEEALTPAEDFYYRLLTVGEQDEIELVETYLKANSLASLYDSVFLPVISALETDHRLELLDDERRTLVEQNLRDIVEDLRANPRTHIKSATESVPAAPLVPSLGPVYCIPARAERDELAAVMLAQLLHQQGVESRIAPTRASAEELIAQVDKTQVEVVCISVVAPSTVLHARYLCLKLRAALPKLRIVVGLWGVKDSVADATRRVRDSGADEVVTTLADALPPLTNPPQPLSLPTADEGPERSLAMG
jgi:predicted PurR-regulated permease PerM